MSTAHVSARRRVFLNVQRAHHDSDDRAEGVRCLGCGEIYAAAATEPRCPACGQVAWLAVEIPLNGGSARRRSAEGRPPHQNG